MAEQFWRVVREVDFDRMAERIFSAQGSITEVDQSTGFSGPLWKIVFLQRINRRGEPFLHAG